MPITRRRFGVLAAAAVGIPPLPVDESKPRDTVTLGEGWDRVEFGPEELMPIFLLIDCTQDGQRLDGKPTSEVQILEEVRAVVPYVPRPMIYLRFSRSDHGTALSLAKKIRATGACDEGGCLFQVAER